jgi:hypothetical protein
LEVLSKDISMTGLTKQKKKEGHKRRPGAPDDPKWEVDEAQKNP